MEAISMQEKLWTLFRSNFVISACTFGGGGVIIPVFQKKYVEDLHWITQDEMMDMIAISQSSPGVMAVNAAIMIGYRIAGLPGALCSILGSVLPPMIILSVLSFLYEAFCSNHLIALLLKGMEAGIAAVMIHVTITMSSNVVRHKNPLNNLLLVGAGVAAVCFQVPILPLILTCAGISLLAALLSAAGKGRRTAE